MSNSFDSIMINSLIDSLKILKASESCNHKSLDKIFKGKKIPDITPFLGTDLFFKSAPLYQSSVDYTTENTNLWLELQRNLKTLKEVCTDKNWLESATQILTTRSQGSTNVVSDQCLSYRKKRRSDEELTKEETCPFVGCDKAYTSKASLKLHMKRNHSETDMIKESFNKPFPVMCQFKKGVDLNRVFKRAYIPKIARKASKNCKFSGKYFEEMTNCSTNCTTEGPLKTENDILINEHSNLFLPERCHNDNDDVLSNYP